MLPKLEQELMPINSLGTLWCCQPKWSEHLKNEAKEIFGKYQLGYFLSVGTKYFSFETLVQFQRIISRTIWVDHHPSSKP